MVPRVEIEGHEVRPKVFKLETEVEREGGGEESRGRKALDLGEKKRRGLDREVGIDEEEDNGNPPSLAKSRFARRFFFDVTG